MSGQLHPAPARGPTRRGPPAFFFSELARAALARLAAPLRISWRRNWLYRRLLKGKLSDRILFHPTDFLPRRLEDADAMLRGRFRFGGDTLDVSQGSVFDKNPPSPEWALSLHSFAFLPPLATAGGDAARTLATNLIAQWVKRYPRYSEPEWCAEVMARRLINLFVHGRFVIANSDVLWRSKLFVSLREQSRQLARIAGHAPDGFARFEAAAALALSGACLDDSPKRLALGLGLLEVELGRQVLPDGGYADRCPETLLNAFRLVLMVIETLAAIDHPVPSALLHGRDRMAPMLRFFRHGDGALALFNGGHESNRTTVAGMLARDEAGGIPFGFAPHSQYQRLTAAKSYAVMDCGPVPPGTHAKNAHAGCLSFEFSSGTHRIVVNCGSGQQWGGALRSTAAHSTLTLADTSMAQVLAPGLARDLLGPRLYGGPREVTSERHESDQGWTVSASHDGYARKLALVHTRQITLSREGSRLTGQDTLTPLGARKGQTPFAVRFHIHPDVRVTPAQGGGILLKLPGGEGWRFRAGIEPAVEESVYMGSESPRKSEQIVLYAQAGSAAVEVAWTFERIGAA